MHFVVCYYTHLSAFLLVIQVSLQLPDVQCDPRLLYTTSDDHRKVIYAHPHAEKWATLYTLKIRLLSQFHSSRPAKERQPVEV